MKIEEFDEALDIMREIDFIKRELLRLEHCNNLDSLSSIISDFKLQIEIPDIKSLNMNIKVILNQKINKLNQKFDEL